MRREKFIIAAFLIILSIVTTETIYIFFEKPNKSTSEKYSGRHVKPEMIKQKKEKTIPSMLSASGWNKDIFYDRSNIYDHWFSLTGIIEFDNGRKAIINDEILRIGEKVKGFTVINISENQVLLTKNKYQVTLNLEQ